MGAKQRILQEFENGNFAGKTLGELCKQMQIPYRERGRLLSLLTELIQDGVLYADENGRYGTPEQLELIKGVISGNERGFAFLIPDDKQRYGEDFFISRNRLYGALHGDSVLVCRVEGREGNEAAVVKILSRGYTSVVGTFRRDRRAGYLIPDEKRFSTDIYIPLSDCHQIPSGVKAVAKITDYPKGKSPGGKIIEVLGEENDFFAEELSIIRSYNLREEFPAHVEKEAQKQERRGITQSDLLGRTDFRKQRIVTIDGADTRDIDDAVHLEKTDDGYILGVHIADVSHYVLSRSALDKEAYERGTSVYFPDCVLPMLPKALSNGICSLNEGEDRLTLSCIMHVNDKGVVTKSEIVEGIIRSAHKMTYDEIMLILDGDEKACKQYADVIEQVRLFADLTRILQARRAARGNVALDVKEAKIFLSEKNEIVIPDRPHMFSHEIIEAFMVLANETVAEYMQSIDAPFIYRIHEKPTEEKANTLKTFAQSLGLTPRLHVDDVKPYDYKNLLDAAKDLPSFSVLNRVMLRSMQKARYSHENVGHFGLASACYCHFTSPIRRYPDLCIHRIIKEILHGKYEETAIRYKDFVSQAADQSSERERRATEAERDVDDLYKTMFMSERIGKQYDAVISGVTTFGLFAELENTIEGFIPIESLYGTYAFDPDRLRLVGTYAVYGIGERVRVKVIDVDFERRRTEFRLISKIQEGEQV